MDDIVLYIIGGHHEIRGYPRASDLYHDTERRTFQCRELLERITAIDVFDAVTDGKRPYNKEPFDYDKAQAYVEGIIPNQRDFALRVREEFDKLHVTS